MKFIILIICLFSLKSDGFAQVKDPGNWKISTAYKSFWSNQHLDDYTKKASVYTINCNTAKKTIYFIQGKDTTKVVYEKIETSVDDNRYPVGDFYYHTIEMGDIIYTPNKKVIRDYPDRFRVEFFK